MKIQAIFYEKRPVEIIRACRMSKNAESCRAFTRRLGTFIYHEGDAIAQGINLSHFRGILQRLLE